MAGIIAPTLKETRCIHCGLLATTEVPLRTGYVLSDRRQPQELHAHR